MNATKMLDRLNTLALGVTYWKDERRKAFNYLYRTLKRMEKNSTKEKK